MNSIQEVLALKSHTTTLCFVFIMSTFLYIEYHDTFSSIAPLIGLFFVVMAMGSFTILYTNIALWYNRIR